MSARITALLDRGRALLADEARPLLTAALVIFQRLGTQSWIERTKAELRAAGIEAADSVVPSAFTELSPQQQQIVQLAAHGLTNREIGEKLFLSPRTVGSHLYRVFPKLGITAQSQLRDVVEGSARPGVGPFGCAEMGGIDQGGGQVQ
ncbi:helix-turn-helix transcriptional regulator [Actinosynnema sp. NPDC047251]|uniref:HTH luxR-type domain-containing protein n=1 Tax=Saccharothrix espanaensis (strain ATCC 51144 / DSM 44229 / JCM 9112 / NBRC 15066 / NRRL 15764) TaxID=1179773 RepID=K0JZW0_SACES|nr:helix-turn-helix transcriptional regulator [Saccharothrix espanaensis]CCH30194.1 hypothetical protein BN6_28850 [Saccharothrix espanaensis DSM 44229]